MNDEQCRWGGKAGRQFTDRRHLIVYLQYALDEVAAQDDISAVLLRMTISRLQTTESLLPSSEGVPKLS
jgi:hypothetical protein